MNTALPAPMPDPTPGEVARGLAALEAHLAEVAPIAPVAPGPAPAEVPAIVETGETKRVTAMRRKVAEAHRLLDLQADEAPLLIDTDKVRRRRAKVAEAARLYELGQDPSVLAWRDQRVRQVTTVMTMTAAVIALTISSIGVQASVVAGLELEEDTAAWWAAFGVEPVLSLPLLAAVSVQAYSAMRGKVIDRKSREGRKLFKTEALLLGLTLVLNCWPAFTGLWNKFDLLPLIVHGLGPVGAVTAIWILPTLWSLLAVLPMPARGGPSDLRWGTHGGLVEDPMEEGVEESPRGRTPDEHRAELRRLIAAGELPARPSARAIQRALRCREDLSRILRDELAGGVA